MSRFDYDWSEQKLRRYIQEGRGQGRGSDYKPFLNVHSISSKGRVSRIKGWKTGRVHHFLSDNETRYFYLCEWSDSVVDIREHYALLDLVEMKSELLDKSLAEKIIDRKTGVPQILTSTFLVTLKDEYGKETHFARNIKEFRELEKTNLIERYEIIRRYWQAKGISWGLITPKEINAVFSRNIEWLHTARQLSDWDYSEDQGANKLDSLLKIINYNNGSIRESLARYENINQSEPGEGLLLFKHLLAKKKIRIDMRKPIDLNQSVDQIKVDHKGSERNSNVTGS